MNLKTYLKTSPKPKHCFKWDCILKRYSPEVDDGKSVASIPLNLDWAVTPSDELDKLYSEIAGTQRFSTPRYNALRLIITNLLSIHYHSQPRKIIGLLYPSGRSNYKPVCKRYARDLPSQRTIVDVLERLEKANLLKSYSGFKGENYSEGVSTIWFPAERLMNFLHHIEQADPTLSTFCSREVIILKDHEKNLTDYEETDFTRCCREVILRSNELRKKSTYTYMPYCEESEDCSSETVKLDKSALAGRRIFSGDFTSGGRIYIPCQNLRKAERRTFLVDGEPTVELDFDSLHPRLAYNLAGLNAPEDCYDVHGSLTKNERKIRKLAFLIILNSKSKHRAIKALEQEGGLSYRNAKSVVEGIEKDHPKISGYFYKDAWRKLQYIDSKIVMGVLDASSKGDEQFPVIPVHDSFVVPASKQETLRELMMEHYHKVTNGFRPIISTQ